MKEKRRGRRLYYLIFGDGGKVGSVKLRRPERWWGWKLALLNLWSFDAFLVFSFFAIFRVLMMYTENPLIPHFFIFFFHYVLPLEFVCCLRFAWDVCWPLDFWCPWRFRWVGCHVFIALWCLYWGLAGCLTCIASNSYACELVDSMVSWD